MAYDDPDPPPLVLIPPPLTAADAAAMTRAQLEYAAVLYAEAYRTHRGHAERNQTIAERLVDGRRRAFHLLSTN